MAKFGFLSILEEEMDKHFMFDHAIDQNRKNHAVEVTFVLETQNQPAVGTVDDQGEIGNDDIISEDYMLFYNQAKSKIDEGDYLVTVPFDAKKSFSHKFLVCFAETLNDVAAKDLDDLVDFLADEDVIGFALEWDAENFENGKAKLKETEYFAYSRY